MKKFLVLLFVLFSSFSCIKNSDVDDNATNSIKRLLIGEWQVYKYERYKDGKLVEFETISNKTIYTFSESGQWATTTGARTSFEDYALNGSEISVSGGEFSGKVIIHSITESDLILIFNLPYSQIDHVTGTYIDIPGERWAYCKRLKR